MSLKTRRTPPVLTSALTVVALLAVTACNINKPTSQSPTESNQVTSSPTTASAPGLVGEYFSKDQFDGKWATQVDARVVFNWGVLPPSGGLLFVERNFSARWTGFLQAKTSEEYTFFTEGHGQAQLWLDDQLVISAGQQQGKIQLQAGQHYAFRLEYKQTGRAPALRLDWSSADIERETVPGRQFTHSRQSKIAPLSLGVGQDVLRNGDFEAGTSGWSYSLNRNSPYPLTDPNSNPSVTTVPGREGAGQAIDLSVNNWSIAQAQDIPLDNIAQGGVYTFEGWGRRVAGQVCTIVTVWRDYYGVLRQSTPLSFGSNIWQKQSVQVVLPAAASDVSVFVRGASGQSPVKCQFDDILLRLGNAPPPAQPPSKNVLSSGNDTFESGFQEWYVPSGSENRISIVEPSRNNTGRALFINGDESSLYITGLEVLNRVLSRGRDYSLSVWGKSLNGGPCRIGFIDTYSARDSGTGYRNDYFKSFNGKEWQRYTVQGYVGDGAWPSLGISLASLLTGQCVFDDVEFGPASAPPAPPSTVAPEIFVPSPIASVGGTTSFDASSFDGTSYQWTFSDGGTANGEAVEHAFTTPGTYTATVTVGYPDGTSKTGTSTVGVLPEVQNIVKKRATSDAMTVEFDAGDPLPGLSYTYDFGDGTTATGSRVSHTYDKLGTYDYRLVIRDTRTISGQRLQTQATDSDVIYDQGSWHTLWRKAPVAAFTFQTPSGQNVPFGKLNPALDVTFDANTSTDPNTESSPLTYAWDFGNGTTATGAQVTARYTAQNPSQRPYVVTLKVTNKWGLSSIRRTLMFVRHPASIWNLSAKYPTVTAQSLSSGGEQGFNSLEDQVRAQAALPHAPVVNKPLIENASLMPQASFDIINTFPYVLSANNNMERGSHSPTSDDGTKVNSFCSEYNLYLNTIQKYPDYVYDYQGDYTRPPTFCSAMVIKPGNLGRLPARQINSAMIASSRGYYFTYFNVFASLSVPKVTVSVVPDEFIPGEQASPVIKEYYGTDPSTGKKQYILNVRFRQSEVQDMRLRFAVPMLAVDASGNFLNRLNGVFNGRFVDTALGSDCGDCVMVNGRSYINVDLFAPTYNSTGQELNLSQVQMLSGSKTCSTDSSALSQAIGSGLNGCDVVTTTMDFPTSTALAEVPPFPSELLKVYQLGAHTFYGEEADAAKAFGIYARVSSVTAQGFVQFSSPYLLAAKHREDLQKVTDALFADGKLTLQERGQLLLANVGYVGSFLPLDLRPATYLAISIASTKNIGATAKAFEKATHLSNTRSMTVSDIDQLILRPKFDEVARSLDQCGINCLNSVDNYVGRNIVGDNYDTILQSLSDRIKTLPKSSKNDTLAQSKERVRVFNGIFNLSSVKYTSLSNDAVRQLTIDLGSVFKRKNLVDTKVSVLQTPTGKRAYGISGARDYIADLDDLLPEVRAIYSFCGAKPGQPGATTNGKCAEAKALTRLLRENPEYYLRVTKNGDQLIVETNLQGTVSAATNLDPAHSRFGQLVPACEFNCTPVIEELGIKDLYY